MGKTAGVGIDGHAYELRHATAADNTTIFTLGKSNDGKIVHASGGKNVHFNERTDIMIQDQELGIIGLKKTMKIMPCWVTR